MSDTELIGKPYRPSNGTEGECFFNHYCDHCLHDNGKDKLCDLIACSMAFDVDEPGYPKEWIYEAENDRFKGVHPVCTKYVHWDWGTDDDPREPPPPPEPDNPNQMVLPFILNEIQEGLVIKEKEKV